ncbi:MAG: hypothetical protein KZQ99_11225 [Candidatus Thiodiazotropha sp. (ex Dulcina madagascariensis)]|nr:hypothetical protein [Candidatus Thiodiazotropha sp. (ex Dulcina madagascariensis)]
MTFPTKLKHLTNIESGDVVSPDEVWLVYAVCAYEDDACGWGGWILEAAKKKGKQLASNTSQKCPACGRTLFRTDTSSLYVSGEVSSL